MKELCIPFTYVADDRLAEVEVKVPSTGEVWRYRIEPIASDYNGADSTKKREAIEGLQRYIDKYDQRWELIQILGINTKTGNIHMLYREKQCNLYNKRTS